MSKTIYTIKDIQKFLYEQGIFWDGINKNENSNDNIILADVVLFSEKGVSNKVEVYFHINGFTFEVFTEDCSIVYQDTTYTKTLLKNLSLDWTKSLLKKYPSIAQNLKTEVENQMNIIHRYTESEIKPLQNKIDRLKEKESLDLAPLKEIREVIISSLSKEPVENITE